MSSVVRLTKPRTHTPSQPTEVGGGEPSRSLLLRAMHEAERSVAAAKSNVAAKSFHHLAADDLYRSRLGGTISLRDRLGARVDVSDGDKASMKLLDQEEHRPADTRFIVTLKGAERLRKRAADSQPISNSSSNNCPAPMSPVIVLDPDDDLEELFVSPPRATDTSGAANEGSGDEYAGDYTLNAVDSLGLLPESQRIQVAAKGRYRIQLNDGKAIVNIKLLVPV